MTTDQQLTINSDQTLVAEVKKTLAKARGFLGTLVPEDFRTGAWQGKLAAAVINAYHKNARAQYFQKKYPGLPADDIATRVISVHAKMAGLVGGGIAAAGTPLPMASLPAQIAVDMISVTYIQLNLLLDLSVIYDLEFDREDPEDVMRLFKYVFGIKAAETSGQVLAQKVAPNAAHDIIKQVIKGPLNKEIYNITKRLLRTPGTPIKAGTGIGQKTILKYAVPGVAIFAASGLNYLSTRAVGELAKADFRRYGTEALRAILHSTDADYEPVFPAALKYVALVDGSFTPEEKQLYRSSVVRMSVRDHTVAEFDKLMASEENILNAIQKIEDTELKQTLLELMKLMAISDGELQQQERDFLKAAAEKLELEIDFEELENRIR